MKREDIQTLLGALRANGVFNRPAVYASPFDPFLNPHRVLAQ